MSACHSPKYLAVAAGGFILSLHFGGAVERKVARAVLIMYALLALIVCTPLVRRARLRRIPDLGDPFQVAAFRDGGSDDAFPLYQEALSRCDALSLERTVPLGNRGLRISTQRGLCHSRSRCRDRFQTGSQGFVAASHFAGQFELSPMGWSRVRSRMVRRR